jgi:transmembrane sensor
MFPRELVKKYLLGESLSPEQSAELNSWLDSFPEAKEWLKNAKDKESLFDELKAFKNPEFKEANWRLLEMQLRSLQKPPARISSWYYIAAACLVLFLCSGLLIKYYLDRSGTKETTVEAHVAIVIKPASPRATLILDNGQELVLDNAANGTLSIQGAAKVEKQNGELKYKLQENTATNLVAYNTVKTPRAGIYNITLADGTRVWLNNASQIHFPAAFAGGKREVDIEGQVYFEVAKDKARPFVVRTKNIQVEVLGTRFDIMAYPEEGAELATLLEGSVRVSKNEMEKNDSKILTRGLQAQLQLASEGEKGKEIKILSGVDVDQVVAWKNGYFVFSHTGLRSVLRQLARWYDVDIAFNGNVGEQPISGKIERTLPLSEILKGLETENVHFKIENRKIIVNP